MVRKPKNMFVKRKENRSGTTSIVVSEKIKGNYNELTTIGIAKTDEDIENFVKQGSEWIDREKQCRHPRLDMFGEECQKY